MSNPATSLRWAGVARFGGVGDNLIITSTFPGLKRRYDRLEVITKKPWGVVFENNPYIDKLTYKEDKDIPADSFDAWQRWFVERANEYALNPDNSRAFYHFSHSCEFLHALFPGQTPFWWPASMRRRICGGSYLETVHDITELPYDPIGATYHPTDDELARARETLRAQLNPTGSRPLVAYVAAGTRIDKIHPRCGYVVARIIKELNAVVAVFGGPEKDRAVAQIIENQVRASNGSLDGLATCISAETDAKTHEENEAIQKPNAWPLRRSLAQLSLCDLVISVDTGPAWAVSSLPIPKVIIVSHASANNITKHWVNTTTLAADPTRVPCHPCHRLHSDFTTCVANRENDGPACTSDVSVEAIVVAVRNALSQRGAAPFVATPVLSSHERTAPPHLGSVPQDGVAVGKDEKECCAPQRRPEDRLLESVG